MLLFFCKFGLGYYFWISLADICCYFFFILATGYVYVNQDLSMEYSFVFRDIEFCIADRRDYDICMTVTINLSK